VDICPSSPCTLSWLARRTVYFAVPILLLLLLLLFHEYGRSEIVFGFRVGKFEEFEDICPVLRIELNYILRK